MDVYLDTHTTNSVWSSLHGRKQKYILLADEMQGVQVKVLSLDNACYT